MGPKGKTKQTVMRLKNLNNAAQSALLTTQNQKKCTELKSECSELLSSISALEAEKANLVHKEAEFAYQCEQLKASIDEYNNLFLHEMQLSNL